SSSRSPPGPLIARRASIALSPSEVGGSRTFSSATGGRGRSETPTVPARKLSACGGRPAGWAGSPHPHQRILGGSSSSATDALQPVERLLERGGGRAAHH